jgi:hypothetical protein
VLTNGQKKISTDMCVAKGLSIMQLTCTHIASKLAYLFKEEFNFRSCELRYIDDFG